MRRAYAHINLVLASSYGGRHRDAFTHHPARPESVMQCAVVAVVAVVVTEVRLATFHRNPHVCTHTHTHAQDARKPRKTRGRHCSVREM
jgi:hypothetical protein